MSQYPDSDLQAELEAVRHRLADLEAKHRELLRRTSRLGRPKVSRKLLLSALPVALLLATGGLLYGQGAGDPLFIHPNGNVGIGTTAPKARLDIAGGDVFIQQSLEIGDRAPVTPGSPNGRIGFPGSGVRHGQIRWTPADGPNGRFEFIDSSSGSPGGDYGASPGFVSIQAQDGRFKGDLYVDGWIHNIRVENALLPIGTIMAYGGNTADKKVVEQLRNQGWLPCNGDPVTKQEYGELFQAIGTAFGGDGKLNFHVPDLRGRFLRGTDQGTGRDPDSKTRKADSKGGNSGDKVGSVQDDQFKQHTHSYTQFPGSRGDIAAGRYWAHRNNVQTGSAGGSETRPKNVYVNWIIKAKHLLSPTA